MNKYLLLRDNKQSGPYTVEELVKLGIKPYDLVWLEGKSAAWRYPSEMDELKPFAPAVEEQPYDRFYKRGSSKEQSVSYTTTTEQQIHTIEQPAVLKTGSGKVYVTLPAGFRQSKKLVSNANQQSGLAEDSNKAQIPAFDSGTAAGESTQQSMHEEPAVSKLAAEALEARAVALARSVQAAAADAARNKQSVNQNISQWNQQLQRNAAVTADNSASSSFSSIISVKQQDETVPVLPVRKQSGGVYRAIMRTIIAVCILLGGVIIGMVLTYSKSHSGDQDALDRLVQRLQEREAQSQSGSVPELPPANLEPGENTHHYTGENQVQDVDEVPPSPQTLSAQNKSIQGETVKEVIPPVDKASKRLGEKDPSVMKITPAVITGNPEQGKLRQPDIADARDKIYQKVQVAASPFKTGVLGGISNLYFTVSNTSSYPVDQIELEIKYLGPEKRVVKVQRLIFNDVAAGGQKTLEAPRTSRGVSIDYAITKINSKALGIAHAGF